MGFTAPPRKSPHKVFGNNAKGHQELALWLTKQCGEDVTVHACLEATGPWGEGVALALHEAGHVVSVVNPAQIRAFGQSQLKRTKTDKQTHQDR
jgi:transposase